MIRRLAFDRGNLNFRQCPQKAPPESLTFMVHRVSTTSAEAAADSAGRFPSSSELEALSGSLRKAQIGLDAAEVLSRGADKLSQDAAQFVFEKFPNAAKASKFLFTAPP